MTLSIELIAMTQPFSLEAFVVGLSPQPEGRYFETPTELLTYAYNYADFVEVDVNNMKHGKEVIQNALKVDATSPLEHIVFLFKIEGISRSCSHQWVRHRICTFTQKSQRRIDYAEGFDFVVPPSIEAHLEPNKSDDAFRAAMRVARDSYAELRKCGVKPQDARFVLPNATTTGFLWTVNASALRHFLKLRMSKRAQWEIREAAKRIFDIVYNVVPEAFEDLKSLREILPP